MLYLRSYGLCDTRIYMFRAINYSINRFALLIDHSKYTVRTFLRLMVMQYRTSKGISIGWSWAGRHINSSYGTIGGWWRLLVAARKILATFIAISRSWCADGVGFNSTAATSNTQKTPICQKMGRPSCNWICLPTWQIIVEWVYSIGLITTSLSCRKHAVRGSSFSRWKHRT